MSRRRLIAAGIIRPAGTPATADDAVLAMLRRTVDAARELRNSRAVFLADFLAVDVPIDPRALDDYRHRNAAYDAALEAWAAHTTPAPDPVNGYSL